MDLVEDLNDVGLSWYYAVTGKKPPTSTPAQPTSGAGTTATISVGGNYLGLMVIALVVAVIVAIVYFVK